ncbi:MAG: hypothetical protein LLF28_03015 [Nitrospiraceae bacterium]|nr:hypothetical protein [Nitrospiraceae bacterium]
MLTGKEDLIQSLIEAYLMEKGTKDFYSEAAQNSTNKSVVKIFTDLSGFEEKHMHFIQFLYQSLIEDKDITGFENFKDTADASFTEAGIPVIDLEARLEKHIFIDENQTLNLALEIEGKAYNLYRKFSISAQDNNAKVVFKEMMAQEIKHIKYLNALKRKLSV